MNRVKIKEKARNIINNNMWNIWKPILIIWGIAFIFSMIFLNDSSYQLKNTAFNLIISLLMMPLSIGLSVYMLNLVRKKDYSINDLFNQYKNFLPILAITFMTFILITLWSVLLIIPGIIALIAYSMVTYLIADGSLNVMDTIKKSKEMMNGYKLDYFIFNLSFLGWILLVFLTFGIAAYYVVPYIITANVLYYEEIKSKAKDK